MLFIHRTADGLYSSQSAEISFRSRRHEANSYGDSRVPALPRYFRLLLPPLESGRYASCRDTAVQRRLYSYFMLLAYSVAASHCYAGGCLRRLFRTFAEALAAVADAGAPVSLAAGFDRASRAAIVTVL